MLTLKITADSVDSKSVKSSFDSTDIFIEFSIFFRTLQLVLKKKKEKTKRFHFRN